MKELQLVTSDDLEYTSTGHRIPADETVVVSLDGKTRELDLTSAHAQELRALLEPYLNAGHVPGHQPAPPGPKVKTPAPGLAAARAKQKMIREFADRHGLRSADGKRPVYRTEGGGYYYPFRLVKMYEAHLEAETAQDAPLP